MAEQMDCPICLTSKEDLVITKCQHKFCRSCVVKLLTEPRPFNPTDPLNCPVCRQTIHAFDITFLANGESLMEKPTTIFGGVYIQACTEGLASYHFDEQESYISYNMAPPEWRLDDGSAPPKKKPFLHSTYDPVIRTFRAIVDWSDVTFGGGAQWIYRIVFSDDFMKISGGEVISYRAGGGKQMWHVYEQDLAYVRLIRDLVKPKQC